MSLRCSSCGLETEATTGGRCRDCNEEDAHLAALADALDVMATFIEERRAARRRGA